MAFRFLLQLIIIFNLNFFQRQHNRCFSLMLLCKSIFSRRAQQYVLHMSKLASNTTSSYIFIILVSSKLQTFAAPLQDWRSTRAERRSSQQQHYCGVDKFRNTDWQPHVGDLLQIQTLLAPTAIVLLVHIPPSCRLARRLDQRHASASLVW